MNKLYKLTLYLFYLALGCVVMLAIGISLALKDYNNVLLIVSSLGVMVLGLHLRKKTKE